MDAENNFLKEFLSCYEIQRCLWDTTSPEYKSRQIKHKSYLKLLGIMKKYKKKCQVEDVKKKINTIRSSYRRELKKINESWSSGADVDSMYQPRIWWFDYCKFLQNCEKPTGKITTKLSEDPLYDTASSSDQADDANIQYEPPSKIEKTIKQKELHYTTSSSYDQVDDSSIHYETPSKIKKTDKQKQLHDTTSCSCDQVYDSSTKYEPSSKIKKTNIQKDLKTKPMSYCPNQSDGFEHLGLAWAAKLRKIQPTQCKLAERLISEVLFQADLEMLTLDTTIQSKRPKPGRLRSSADRHFRIVRSQPSRNSHTMTYRTPSTPTKETEMIFLSSLDDPVTHIIEEEQMDNDISDE